MKAVRRPRLEINNFGTAQWVILRKRDLTWALALHRHKNTKTCLTIAMPRTTITIDRFSKTKIEILKEDIEKRHHPLFEVSGYGVKAA